MILPIWKITFSHKSIYMKIYFGSWNHNSNIWAKTQFLFFNQFYFQICYHAKPGILNIDMYSLICSYCHVCIFFVIYEQKFTKRLIVLQFPNKTELFCIPQQIFDHYTIAVLSEHSMMSCCLCTWFNVQWQLTHITASSHANDRYLNMYDIQFSCRRICINKVLEVQMLRM